MKFSITREEALNLLKEKLSNKNMVKHCLAVEVVMRGLSHRLNQDEEGWGLAGLLHDVDSEMVGGDMMTHSLESGRIMREIGFSEEIVQAVEAHNEVHGLPRESVIAKALWAADPVTGLVVAAALVHPDKKLSSLNLEFIIRRFGEKWFAKGANREQIRSIEELGISLDEFISLALLEMQNISGDLGL